MTPWPLWEGNYPSEQTRQRLLDEHFFQRAMQVYLGALPAVNMIGLREGSEAKFGSSYNVLPIWKTRMEANCLVPTPNVDVVYGMSYLDLKEDGAPSLWWVTGEPLLRSWPACQGPLIFADGSAHQ